MPKYSYLARDKSGKAVRGTISIDDEKKLALELERKELLLIKSQQVRRKKIDFKEIFNKGRGVGKKDLIVFTRQFATMVRAGIPVIKIFETLWEETESKSFKKIILTILKDIQEGKPLSDSLHKHPKCFPKIYIEMVKAGESAGTLDVVLLNLAQTLERDYRLNIEVKNALRYPLIVVTAIGFAIIFITTFVVPKFASVYSQFNVALPIPTRIMIKISSFMVGYWWLLIILVSISWIVFNFWKNSAHGEIIWGKYKLKIPLFGKLFEKISLLRFCFIFNTLNEVGLPIITTLEIVKSTLGNAFLGKRIEIIKEGVLEGKTLSSLIIKDKNFPKLLGNMIGVGEQSGSLDLVLNSLAEYYQLEVTSTVEGLTVAIEPALTGLLAACVLFLALAVFLPLWNMTQVFKLGG
jgi:type II secretory pathway component PulF